MRSPPASRSSIRLSITAGHSGKNGRSHGLRMNSLEANLSAPFVAKVSAARLCAGRRACPPVQAPLGRGQGTASQRLAPRIRCAHERIHLAGSRRPSVDEHPAGRGAEERSDPSLTGAVGTVRLRCVPRSFEPQQELGRRAWTLSTRPGPSPVRTDPPPVELTHSTTPWPASRQFSSRL